MGCYLLARIKPPGLGGNPHALQSQLFDLCYLLGGYFSFYPYKGAFLFKEIKDSALLDIQAAG